ncbi:MAG TPA: hypothetical protein PLX73_01440 [Candidatus Paceibacterota bacterium]|nr:hypothetical protein [Candidatus Paceibacterota bacterium]HOL54115.1 hypothetical protein [Candidatus Paceibacterota bacterium]HON21836.1 hypothetical protein [Candidatus Paceibacterota bacterium]HPP17024.1 hypothetical protein [Candidatus Paceibacterota bacterium]
MKSNVQFQYDINEDKKNILRVINHPSNFGGDVKRQYGRLPLELVNNLKTEKDPFVQDRIVSDFLKQNLIKKGELINQKIERFQKDWDKINDEYFKRLEKILDIQIPADVIYKAYLTSAGSCPFDASARTFMVRMDDEMVDTVAAHEIMHIELWRNYGIYCRDILKLSPKEFGVFQESATVLLNEEMGDILSRPDYGYKEHQEMRLRLAEEWKRTKNFRGLLKYYKGLVSSK